MENFERGLDCAMHLRRFIELR